MIRERLYHTLSLEARRKVVAIRWDENDKRLGMSCEQILETVSSVSTLIHTVGNSSFKELGQLLSFCQTCTPPARMNICEHWMEEPASEAQTEPARARQKEMGLSKSTAERTCAKATEQGISARVLQLGQIMLHVKNGMWKVEEAQATMLNGAIDLEEDHSRIPVDMAAEAVVHISLLGMAGNVTIPKRFTWVDSLPPVLREVKVEMEQVDSRHWTLRLRFVETDAISNSLIELLKLLAGKFNEEDCAEVWKCFATVLTEAAGPGSILAALANVSAIGGSRELLSNMTGHLMENSGNEVAVETLAMKRVILIAGPSGTGKSTVGPLIASWLCVPFIEGDSLHSQDAVTKMGSNRKLTDEYRDGWLKRVCAHARESVMELDHRSVVISCSALKRLHRDTIRWNIADSNSKMRPVFIMLEVDRDVLVQRLEDRKGHYMGPKMVDGQLETLEAAGGNEDDVLPVDGEAEPAEVFENVKWLLKKERQRWMID